jgi:hypothetical protein
LGRSRRSALLALQTLADHFLAPRPGLELTTCGLTVRPVTPRKAAPDNDLRKKRRQYFRQISDFSASEDSIQPRDITGFVASGGARSGHSGRRNVNRLRQRMRRHSEWREKFLAQDFAGVNRTHMIPGHARPSIVADDFDIPRTIISAAETNSPSLIIRTPNVG